MTLKHLIQKEFIQIRRNSFLPKMIVMFPIMVICVIPWITSLEVRNINVCVVDNDMSLLSSQLVERVKASEYFIFNGYQDTYRDAQALIEKGKIDVVCVIPPHYSRDVKMGRSPQVYIAANSVNGTKGAMGSAYLTQIISRNIEPKIAESSVMTMSEVSLYNPHLNYKVFMIPALMAILIVMMCGFMPSLNIVGEKERGTIEQINVTPVKKWEFILAKLVPYWIIGLFILSVSLLLSWLVYGITSAGNLWLIYLLAMLLSLVFSGLGLVISNYSDTMQQAMLVMWFFMVIFMLLSGLFTPVRSMPDWAQYFTLVNPMRYFIDAMRTVFVRGGDFASIHLNVSVLVVIALALNVWAVISYKKNS